MATKQKVIGKASAQPQADDIRADLAWEAAKAALRPLGMSPGKPDLEKIKQASAKQKKDVEYVVEFDGKWVSVYGRVGGKKVDDVFSQDISDGGDAVLQKKRMEALKQMGVISDADVKAFDKKMGDPQKVNDLKKEAAEIGRKLKIKQMELKRAAETVKALQKEVGELEAEAKAKLGEVKKAGG